MKNSDIAKGVLLLATVAAAGVSCAFPFLGPIVGIAAKEIGISAATHMLSSVFDTPAKSTESTSQALSSYESTPCKK